MNPWPVAWFAQDGKRIKVLESRLAENPQHAAPGTVLALKPLDDCRRKRRCRAADCHARGRQADGGHGLGRGPPPESGGQPVTPRRLAVKALIHQEQAGYANLVLDAELKKCDAAAWIAATPPLPRAFFTHTLERLPLLDYTYKSVIPKSPSPSWTRRCAPCCGRDWHRHCT